MRLPLLLILLLAASLLPSRADAASFILNSSLHPLPGVESSGFGFGEVDVSDDQQSIFVTLFVSGLNGNVDSGTGIYGPGQFGGLNYALLVPFPSFTSGVLSGTFGISGSTLSNLLAGQLFFTVYTNQFSFGEQQPSSFSLAPTSVTPLIYDTPTPEIGGQISFAPEPRTTALLGLALIAIGYAAWRRSRAISA